MSDRYTRKDAEKAFDRLCEAAGKRKATSYKDVGGWRLDYNPTYGGCNVEEIINEGGGINHPLGPGRRSPRVFCETVWFATSVLAVVTYDRLHAV